MMMVEITALNSVTFFGEANFEGTRLLPADRCLWEQLPDSTGGYTIENVRFFGGSTANGILFATTGSGTINYDARLGYIGKSGRFVPISN